jgi:3-isopropylmalate/(R)-2-methylmalate dehydratase small subunit
MIHKAIDLADPGDIIVAGSNFGCGSAMEAAVIAILGAEIPAVLARSFSRTHYRKAINNGLLPIVCDTGSIREGDRLSVRRRPTLCVRNEESGEMLVTEALPRIMLDILEAGGLVSYMRQRGGFVL